MKFWYYFYYRIYSFLIKISDDFLNDIKPFAIIQLLQILILAQCFCWYIILTQKAVAIEEPRTVAIPIMAALTAINYFVFMHQNKWEVGRTIFEQYSKSKRITYDLTIAIIIILIILGTIFSFNRMSKMDFRKNNASARIENTEFALSCSQTRI